ncbi:hypothetical protein PT065_00005, partial [Erysipelothrix rhusiopathiae]|nr:hypothetical protein [Erysipelothrix rhusiopathiae]
TKEIIFSLPIRPYNNSDIDNKIVEITKKMMISYDYNLDLKLEQFIMEKYELTDEEIEMVSKEMDKLPNLSAINTMKMRNVNV